MKRAILISLMLLPVVHGHAGQAPMTIAVDVLEFDCAASPGPCEAFERARFLPDGGAAVIEALAHSSTGQPLVSHTQMVTPGVPIEHATVIRDVRFELALTVSEPERGRNSVDARYTIVQGEADTLAGGTTMLLMPGEGPLLLGASSESAVTSAGAPDRALTLVLLRVEPGR